MNILDLPDCMLEQVLDYFSYDEIAKQRIVSSKEVTALNFNLAKEKKFIQ